jgi:hypothetical protein
MLINLLGYLLLGLVLAWPLWHLLHWLGRSSGLYQPQWKYLLPYVQADARRVQPEASDGSEVKTQP